MNIGLTHWDDFGSLLRYCPSARHRETWWCSSGSCHHHSKHQGTDYKSPAWRTAAKTHWMTSWGQMETFLYAVSVHNAYWSIVVSSSISNCIICNKAHQNSPSSICMCKSSFSDGSISSHSGELRREHTQSSYSMTWAELNKSFCVISYLSLQAPVHSTWPHGLRIRISLSVQPLNSTCQREERSHTWRHTKLNSNVSMINIHWERYLFKSSHWVSVTLNQLLKRYRFHVKGTGDLKTIINKWI